MISLILLWSAFPACKRATNDASPGTIELETAFPALSFTRPLAIESPPDSSHRLVVVEQAGRIYVFPNDNNVKKSRLFLDIRKRVYDEGNEEGLLGLAFHPAYKTNGYFYLNYTASNPARSVIARYRVSPTDPDAADPSSELVLLEYAQPFSNHKGDSLRSGPTAISTSGPAMGDRQETRTETPRRLRRCWERYSASM